MLEPDTDAPLGDDEDARYAIGDLAEAAGVSRRAVRFYVQRGLLPAPLGGGRGAFYTAAHLERLLTVKRFQEAGLPLDEIARALDAADANPAAQTRPTAERGSSPTQGPSSGRAPLPHEIGPSWASGSVWMRLLVAPGVELAVEPARIPAAQREALASALRAVLEEDAPADHEAAAPRDGRRRVSE